MGTVWSFGAGFVSCNVCRVPSQELGFFVRQLGRFRTTSKPFGKDCPIAHWFITPDPLRNAHVEGLKVSRFERGADEARTGSNGRWVLYLI